MKTAMPFAVAARKTEPVSESAHRIATAPASPIAGVTMRSGHQPPSAQVITVATTKTTIT